MWLIEPSVCVSKIMALALGAQLNPNNFKKNTGLCFVYKNDVKILMKEERQKKKSGALDERNHSTVRYLVFD